MNVEKIGLPWARPALLSAAEWLIERYADDSRLDLRQVVVVLPGGRAGRRLLEILTETAEERGLLLFPPQIRTVGRLPELLYQPQRLFADDLTQQLAWSEAIRAIDPVRLRQHLAPSLDPTDTVARLELADLLRRRHVELAADRLLFADVAEQVTELAGPAEAERWRLLADLQDKYLRILDAVPLWDVQTARIVAVDRNECSLPDRRLVLVGTVDMNRTLRAMLEQVADRVTVLVHAPEEWADRFDELGCLVPDRWQEVSLDLADEQIHLAEDAAAQADEVLRLVADLAGRFAPDDITLGLADQRAIPFLTRRLEPHDVKLRWGPGRSIAESMPFRLLQQIQRYLQGRWYPELAALLRQADWADRIQRRLGLADASWIAALDVYFNEHLPSRVGSDSLLGEPEKNQLLRAVLQETERLLQPLLAGKTLPLNQWSGPIRQLFDELYGSRKIDLEEPADRLTFEAVQALNGGLEQFHSLPESLLPSVDAATALDFLLDRVRGALVPPAIEPDAIEMVGWLELALDDAPALIVTDVVEGLVPGSVSSDLFLPNELRRRLSLEDNRRRYARDAYALGVLAATRQRLHMIVPRRDAEGDNTSPSRLLLACPKEQLTRRVRRLFDEIPAGRLPPADPACRPIERHAFLIPDLPLPAEPIDSLSVTVFRDYLACPYRFYLSRVLHLEPCDDAAEELDGAGFGNMLHEVLDQFGRGPRAASSDEQEIFDQCESLLEQYVRRRFGAKPLSAVDIQVQQARLRLKAFAAVQARRAADGWEIIHCEQKIQNPLTVDEKPFYLRGRIDRIDRHRETGQTVVLDYKTGDSGDSPENIHRKGPRGEKTWIDLQLPLYRHLVPALGIEGPVGLGYIVLPKDTGKTDFLLAEWTRADLDEADRTAEEVIRDIRRSRFGPPVYPPPSYSESLAPICQDRTLDRRPSDQWKEVRP